MRVIKATLFGVIVVSVAVMWSSRTYVTDAYETTPNTLQLRLSGVDLAVTQSELEPSPYDIPAAPDTRHRPPPALSTTEPTGLPATVALTGGTASLRGVVTGPAGPIAGALVGIERHTSHGIGTARLATGEDGDWSIGKLPGGRYRVRAWVPNLMTMGGSEVTFLADGQALAFEFSLWGVDPSPTMELIDGGPIYDGLSGTVAVAVSQRAVDADGLIVTTPTPGLLVTVQVSPEMTLASNPLQFTDGQGAARFILACIPATSGVPPDDPPGADVPGSDVPTVDSRGQSSGAVLTGQTIVTSGVGSGATGAAATHRSAPAVTGIAAMQSVDDEADDQAGPPGSTGTLTAQAGTLVDSFPLPGCQPIPDQTADVEADLGALGQADG